MPHSSPISYSLFPKDVGREMPDIARLQRPGSSRSLEQPCANTPLPACIRAQPSPSGGIESFPNPPELCVVKMAESEHRRAHSNPAGRPTSSRRSSFSRLRRTISAPINQKPLVVHGKWTGGNETDPKNIASKSVRPSNPTTELQERNKALNGLPAPPPTRSASTVLKNSSRNFIRSALSAASHDSRGAALPPPPPPPPPPPVPPPVPPAPPAHRPLSTLQEESLELEGLPPIALLPAIQLNDCKPWIPGAIESPTRANAVAPPPLKLRAPIKEGTTAPPALALSIPQKEQCSVPTPPSNPISRPRNKKHVHFAPTSPEIITSASIKALNRERAQQLQKTSVARHPSLQKHHPSWSAVFLLSAPSTANDNNNRPSSSPGPRPAPQHTGPKSILRRSSSFQNMRHDADDEDSDVEIKPLEDHVHLVISAAMEKNLTRLPRSKSSARFRKNNPLPALPAHAGTPPTPAHNLNYNYNQDHASRDTHHAPVNFPQRPPSPPSPPEPLASRKFRHPVVISHPPSPPSSSASSRDASPASSRSSSSEREGSMFRTFTVIKPLRYSSQKAGKKEERVGRARPERVTWRAVA